MQIKLTQREAIELIRHNVGCNADIIIDNALHAPLMDININPKTMITCIHYQDKILDIQSVRGIAKIQGVRIGLAEAKYFVEEMYMIHHGTMHAQLKS